MTIRLNSRVEKFSREACARIVGGAKFCTLASTSAPTACLDSFRPSIAGLDRAQARDRVLDVDRQRAAHGGDAVAGASRAGPGCGSRPGRARAARGPRCARRASAASARSAPLTTVSTTSLTVPPNAFLTGLKSSSSLRTTREAAVRADLDVERRRRAPGSAPPTRPRRRPRPPRAPSAAPSAGRVASDAARGGRRTPVLHQPARAGRERAARRSARARGSHGLVGVRDLGGTGLEVEEHVARSTPAMPSTSAWWVLEISAKRPSVEALDEPHLPQRLGAVELLGEDPRRRAAAAAPRSPAPAARCGARGTRG